MANQIPAHMPAIPDNAHFMHPMPGGICPFVDPGYIVDPDNHTIDWHSDLKQLIIQNMLETLG